MNLIEQLGGYEKAKDYVPDGYKSDRLKRLLLQYRREHNLFEVGDAFVSDCYQLETIFFVTHSDFDDEYVYSTKVMSDKKLKGDCRFLFKEIRHATDAEIEAGKRLEVG